MARTLFALLTAGALGLAHAEPPAKTVASELQPFVESHTLAGAVTLVANKEKVLSVETVGFADIAAKKPMTPDALFWIASMSKSITATALMMLVDEGKVNSTIRWRSICRNSKANGSGAKRTPRTRC